MSFSAIGVERRMLNIIIGIIVIIICKNIIINKCETLFSLYILEYVL